LVVCLDEKEVAFCQNATSCEIFNSRYFI